MNQRERTIRLSPPAPDGEEAMPHTSVSHIPGNVLSSSRQTAAPYPATLRAYLAAVLLPGLLALFLSAWVLSWPWHTRIDIGGQYDSPYLQGFHAAEYNSQQDLSFRWSQPAARLTLPGAGPSTVLELRLHGSEDLASAMLEVGTGRPLELPLRPGWQRVVLLPPADPLGGDATVTLQTAPQVSDSDPRERGIVLDRVALTAQGHAPLWGQAFLIGLSVALASLLSGWASRRAWIGLLIGLLLALALAAVLAIDGGSVRLMLTAYTGRLVLVLAVGGGVALGMERLLNWLNHRGIVCLSPAARRALAAVALLAFVLRFGGMAYPLNYNSDLPLILGRTWLVREGQLASLFFPNPALTPVQWGEGFTIPRSPFYYIITVPVTLLPGEAGAELGMMAWSSAVDALAVVLVGILALYAGGGSRAGVMAAFLAATLPVGLMFTVSWGILPTLFGQCLALLTLVLWLNLRPRLHERRAWLLLAAALTVTFVSYPTAMLFLGTTGVLLVAALALQRDPATLPTLSAALVALVAAFVLYYGWHVPAMVSHTLPTLLGEAAESNTASAGVSLSRSLDALWVQLFDKYSAYVLLLALFGALLLALTRLSPRGRDTRLVLFAWAGAFVPLALADEYVVTFILKHILHILPVLAVLGGVFLGRLSRQRGGHVLVWALLALTGWQGLILILDAVVNGFVQLK